MIVSNYLEYFFDKHTKKTPRLLQAKTLTFANPGYSRTGKIQMLRGGVSDPRNRTILILSHEKKQAINAINNVQDSSSSKTRKTLENQQKKLEYLKDHGRSKCPEIAIFLGLSEARTRAIITNMPEIEIIGSNRNRTYRIK